MSELHLEKEEDIREDYSLLQYSFKVTDAYSGGAYYVREKNENGVMGEKAKFFVFDYSDKDTYVTGDWNLNVIKKGDVLSGVLSLKTLNKKFSEFKSITYQYTFLDHQSQILKETQPTALTQPYLSVKYPVPDNFQNIITFTLKISADEQSVTYSKDFRETLYQDVVIDFKVQTGKMVRNASNTIYFAAYKDKNKKEVVDVNQG